MAQEAACIHFFAFNQEINLTEVESSPTFLVVHSQGLLFEVQAKVGRTTIGTLRVYRDHVRGGIEAAPWVAEEMRGRGFAAQLYIEGARILLSQYGVVLSSNPHPGQSTPNDRRVWDKLVASGYAVQIGNTYQFIASRLQERRSVGPWPGAFVPASRYLAIDAQ
jgi:hypothetical protein